VNTPRLLEPNGLSTDMMTCRVNWASAGEAGPDPRGKFRGELIFEHQRNLDIGKTLTISARRFRKNLDMGIFPIFF
jgi:hypothetical protein